MKKIFGLSVSHLILAFLVAWVAWKMHGCYNQVRFLQDFKTPVFVHDTLHIPQYKEKLSFVEKIKWRQMKPCTIQIVKYEQWMDSSYKALSLAYGHSKGNVRVVYQKGNDVRVESFYGVTNDFLWYGTHSGGWLIQTRFSNPIKWTGILIGVKGAYSDRLRLHPYIETGYNVKRLSLLAGAENDKVYMKCQWRLW